MSMLLNLHMLLHPEILEEREFRGSRIAVIDETKCVDCSICREKCRCNAITEDLTVDPFSCEGCSVCVIVCPVNAVTLTERVSGYVYISKIRYGFTSHALLKPGEANSGKLVTVVRQNAKLIAEKEKSNLIIIDGPPGIACPAITSVTGVDAGLVVTEPTLSGIHDLERAVQLLRHFNVRPFVCVNMYDINEDNTENDVDVLFNPVVTEATVNGKAIVEYSLECDVAKKVAAMWRRLCSELSLEVTC